MATLPGDNCRVQLVFHTDVLTDALWGQDAARRQALAALDIVRRGEAEGWYAPPAASSILHRILHPADPADRPDHRTERPASETLQEVFSVLQPLPSTGEEWLEIAAGDGDDHDPDAQLAVRLATGYLPNPLLVTCNPRLLQAGTLPAARPDTLTGRGLSAWEGPASDLPFIDLSAQQRRIRTRMQSALHRVLHHGRYIMGPEIDELESRLAAFTGSRHCITCSSGTDALLIALMALGIGPGDEVITVPYTWISTAEVIALLGARPVFVDIRPDTMNIDPALIEPAITPRTRAILPVGIYGQCAEMDTINAVAARHGLPVLEDGAQSFGALHRGRRSCALSEIGCTSFFPTKPLAGYGDGGAIFTDDEALAETMCQIRNHGQKIKHEHPLIGLNGRLDTLQAAILLEKLDIFPQECELRRKVARCYDERLAGVEGITTPHIADGNVSVYAQYTLLADDREALSEALQAAGIPSVSYYSTPLHLQGAFANLGHGAGNFPATEKVASECLSLPMSPYLAESDIQRVAQALK